MAPSMPVPPQQGGARLPAYLVIAQMLRQQIWGGKWSAGSTLPSERELAAQFAVADQTLRKALGLLREEGLIVTRHGLGTYVQALPEREQVKLTAGDQIYARLALPAEKDTLRVAEGVPVLVIVSADGTEHAYDANRTVISG